MTGKRHDIHSGNLFKAGKHAVEDCAEVKVVITGATAKVHTTGHDGKVRRRAMSVFDWQSFSTGYTIRLAELKQIA